MQIGPEFMGKKTLEEFQLTISNTRFGSKSKWPINDCKSKLNQNYDHYYYKTNTENRNSHNTWNH
jgi:hypothetical protein